MVMVVLQLFVLWSLSFFLVDDVNDCVDDIGVNPGFQDSFVLL